ncbi:hypothetical protein GXP67_02630 [Rhodocytophaga rosea]|uniref:DUF3887 domain-containing protein n=1 Tax=Rhodocytophaga rosea TaxID=2704465 RepID=A0A6C0GCN3_9BACT|nr:hypothetical protein [Rhodocytophaga rosea]QHT65638.1 hypothetical protein GXP67_02630 [Rhodocytophaga rosea]
MKTSAIILLFIFFTVSPLLAQKANQSPNNKTISNPMLLTDSFKSRLVDFLHESFPDSKATPVAEMKKTIHTVLQKAIGYGLDNEADLAAYVITAYVLGENFDQEIPEAKQLLQDTGYTSNQKANQLETWTRQVMQTLEEYKELAQQVGAKQKSMQQNAQVLQQTDHSEAPVSEYMDMQQASASYHQMANWAVERLRSGDLTSVMRKFSANFMDYLGKEKVEKVFAEQMLPYFVGSTGIDASSTITMTTDSFGSKGFAFYLNLTSAEGKKPFIVYIVNENNQLVVANLVLNKTYADMH